MKIFQTLAVFSAGVIAAALLFAFTGILPPPQGYILEHEKDIAIKQPGPHDGGGTTTAYPFFSGIKDFKMAFRKRTLHPGSSIGYHLQETDEIYYILSGSGEMTVNGKTFLVNAGDALLTRPGSSHGLKPKGNDNLTLIISYLLN